MTKSTQKRVYMMRTGSRKKLIAFLEKKCSNAGQTLFLTKEEVAQLTKRFDITPGTLWQAFRCLNKHRLFNCQAIRNKGVAVRRFSAHTDDSGNAVPVSPGEKEAATGSQKTIGDAILELEEERKQVQDRADAAALAARQELANIDRTIATLKKLAS